MNSFGKQIEEQLGTMFYEEHQETNWIHLTWFFLSPITTVKWELCSAAPLPDINPQKPLCLFSLLWLQIQNKSKARVKMPINYKLDEFVKFTQGHHVKFI